MNFYQYLCIIINIKKKIVDIFVKKCYKMFDAIEGKNKGGIKSKNVTCIGIQELK